jgi:hypothetical protein
MATIDSEASFISRALSFGVLQSDLDLLKVQKYCSFGAFTFIATYHQSDDKPLKDVLTDLLGAEPTNAAMGKWRRLHFEAHAITVSDAKSRVEGTSDDAPKRLPAPERALRYETQRKKLVGLVWTSSLEPSHSLIDRLQQQYEENQATFVSLELCTSRLQELSGVKKDKKIAAVVEHNTLKITTKDPDVKAPIASDLALRQAFRRRALAYDQCNLVVFEVLEAWTEKLFTAMEQTPPPGYSSISRFQILGADKELFIRVIEKCRAGIVPTVNGLGVAVRPLEVAINMVCDDPSVLFHLLPLPSSYPGKKKLSIDEEMDADGDHHNKKHKGGGRGKKDKGKGKGGKEGKSKGKGKGGKDELPKALAGCWKYIKNEVACRWYNIGTCHAAVSPGEKCNNGIHLCMAPKCGLPHPANTCDKNPSKGGPE